MNPVYLTGDGVFNDILIAHGGRTLAEIKEDGYRVQLHKCGDRVTAFTRSKNQVLLDLYPELSSSIANLPDCILDAELVGKGLVGKDAFDAVKTRFRPRIGEKGKEQYLGSGIIESTPLELRVFDTLYWEGRSLIDEPLTARRKFTQRIDERVITPSTQRDIGDTQALASWFETLVGSNYEGLVCKRPESVYTPGARTTDWVKVKRAEPYDLVVVGGYLKDGALSHVLCAAYNPLMDRYETLAKVNADRHGMNTEITSALRGKTRKTPPADLLLNPRVNVEDGDDRRTPDFYVTPARSIVVEIAAMNVQRSKNSWHSCGLEDGMSYSLRIGWLKRLRDDKLPSQATTLDAVRSAYAGNSE